MRVTRMFANRAMPASRSRLWQRAGQQQRGAIVIMFAALLILMIAFMGLALDLARLYNRKVELQSVADAAALAAAERLIGTAGSIDAAVASAAAAASERKYSYEKVAFTWDNDALKFSASATGGWMDASAAKAAPEGVVFAKVDTADLGVRPSTIDNFMMRILYHDLAKSAASAIAVAGRSTINVAPLALCAMSSNPAAARPPLGELVQYGFRRGVGYNLMELNPGGPAARHYVINPIDPAGPGASAGNTGAAVVGPFACAGNMPMTGVLKGQISVSHPFPLAGLYEQLNSRFDQFSGGVCNYRSAPPDVNIKTFLYSAGNSWMSVTPAGQTANSHTDDGKLMTVADAPWLAPGTSFSAPMYGLLWSYAQPVPYSAYLAAPVEPQGGYAPFLESLWPSLYALGMPVPKNAYSSVAPYFAGGSNSVQPNPTRGRGVRNRRVLNVPLLECPVAGGSNASATVLAIGKFFMTVPATPTSLHAEFAGLASEQALGGTVELYK